MKKIILSLISILSVFVLFSCTKAEETAESNPIGKVDLAIAAKGGVAFVQVSSESGLKAVTTSDWLEVSVKADTVYAEASVNESIQSRYATLMVTADGETYKFCVMQYGYATAVFSPCDKTLKSDAAEITFPYEYTELMNAATDASWVALSITDESLTISVEENTDEATADNRQRQAEINWSLGMEHGTITITQHAKNFMTLDDNWTLSYLGVQQYNGNDVEEIQNTVATDDGIGYAIYACLKSDLGSEDVATYAEVDLPEILKSNFDYYISYYKTLGYDLSYSDFYYTGTEFEIFDIFDAGDYVAIAVGLDDNCNLTGEYQYLEFTKEGGSGDDDKGYSAWLGEWEIARNGSTDTWTIATKTDGETYSITGIEGQAAYAVEAEYDASTGSMLVKVQEGLGTYTSTNYGELTIGFYGTNGSGSFWRPGTTPYTIFTATLTDANTASLTPTTLSTSSGDVTLAVAKFIGTSSESKYVSLVSDAKATQLPNTLTKKGSGGGGGGDEGGHGSDAYNRFIGSWTGTPADTSYDPWTTRFTEVQADSTIAGYAWQGWDYEWLDPIDIRFNSADGTVTFKGGTGVAAASNIDVGADGNADIYYMGRVEMNGNYYVITSGTSMYDCCKATYTDGNLVLTGCDVKLSNGNTYQFVDFGIVALDSETSGSNFIYTYKTTTSTFPVTLTPASSSSSVKVFGMEYDLSIENAERLDPSQILTVASEECLMTPEQAYDIPVGLLKHLSK